MAALDVARASVAAWSDGWARHDPDVIAARYANGTDTTIHGVSLLRVGPDRLIAEHRDTWTELEGDQDVALMEEDA